MPFSKFTAVFSRVAAAVFGPLSAGFDDALRVGANLPHQGGRLLGAGLGQAIAPVGRLVKIALLVFLALTSSADRASTFSGSQTSYPRN
jgi:hypothetical protein